MKKLWQAQRAARADQKLTDYPGCARGVMFCRSTVCGCRGESRPKLAFLMARIRIHMQPDRWRHRKGGVYKRLGTALHSETLEELVLYTDSSGQTWARPREMFEDGRFTPEGGE